MDTLEIRKQNDQYVVPALVLSGPIGQRRLIPNPQGKEAAVFSTLEEAVEAVLRAGYQPFYENHSVGHRSPLTKPMDVDADTVVQTLEAKLSDTVPQVVAAAASALGEFRVLSSLPALLKVFSHEDGQVRKLSAEAIGKYGLPALEGLRKSMRSSHWVVRHTVVLAMTDMITFHRETVGSLLIDLTAALSDEQWLVRSQAAQGLCVAGRVLREENG